MMNRDDLARMAFNAGLEIGQRQRRPTGPSHHSQGPWPLPMPTPWAPFNHCMTSAEINTGGVVHRQSFRFGPTYNFNHATSVGGVNATEGLLSNLAALNISGTGSRRAQYDESFIVDVTHGDHASDRYQEHPPFNPTPGSGPWNNPGQHWPSMIHSEEFPSGYFGNNAGHQRSFGSGSGRRSRSRNAGFLYCRYCYCNGEAPATYQAHVLHSESGIVLCPILRKYVCPICQATGDYAHTQKYCPQADGPKHVFRTTRTSTGDAKLLRY